MRVITDLAEMTETARGWLAGGMVGFLPIASSLHDGHLLLIQTICESCEISVVSLIDRTILLDEEQGMAANSTTQHRSVAWEPRDLSRDLALLDETDVDVVFIPRREALYPEGFSLYVTPTGALAERLKRATEKKYGRKYVTTLVKLFELVRPDTVFFGQKDAAQVAIMRQLVRDLNIDVNLHVLPTVRENDGLAAGSRNRQLTPRDRQAAVLIYQALLEGQALAEKGERRSASIIQAVTTMLSSVPSITLDYVIVCQPDTLADVSEAKPGSLLAIGAYVGEIYLYDNILLP